MSRCLLHAMEKKILVLTPHSLKCLPHSSTTSLLLMMVISHCLMTDPLVAIQDLQSVSWSSGLAFSGRQQKPRHYMTLHLHVITAGPHPKPQPAYKKAVQFRDTLNENGVEITQLCWRKQAQMAVQAWFQVLRTSYYLSIPQNPFVLLFVVRLYRSTCANSCHQFCWRSHFRDVLHFPHSLFT